MIDPFLLQDVVEAESLHHLCFPDDAWPAKAFSALISAGAFGFIHRVGVDMDGLILVQSVLDEAEILTFAVAPVSRRQGTGSALLQTTLEALRGRGITQFFLEVGETNQAAIALYEKLGFAQFADRTAYYRHGADFETALIMKKILIPAFKDHF